MNKHWMNLGAALTAGTLLLAGCATDEYGNRRAMTETEKGVGIGALTGAAAGALIANKSAKGAALGAVGGAVVGGLIGNYMEQQRRDFEKLLAAEIASGAIRVEKLPDDRLLVGMTGATAFEVDSDRIQPGFYSTMDKISGVVNKYGKTELSSPAIPTALARRPITRSFRSAARIRSRRTCSPTTFTRLASAPRVTARTDPLRVTIPRTANAGTGAWISPSFR